MRTCLKTAGKGNSTYCLQTWTHTCQKMLKTQHFLRDLWALRALASLIYIYIPRKPCFTIQTEQQVLLGFSMGGGLAMELALRLAVRKPGLAPGCPGRHDLGR